MLADDGIYAQNWIQLSQRVNVCNTVLCACLSKIWCHAMHLVSIVKLESTLSPEFFRAYCDLINETKRTESMNISMMFFAESSLCSRRILVFRIGRLLRIADFPFFSIWFSVLWVSDLVFNAVFGFSYLDSGFSHTRVTTVSENLNSL